MEEDVLKSVGAGRPAAPYSSCPCQAAPLLSAPRDSTVDRRVASRTLRRSPHQILAAPHLASSDHVTLQPPGRSRNAPRRSRSREPRPHRHLRHSSKRAPSRTIHELFAEEFRRPQSHGCYSSFAEYVDDALCTLVNM